MLRGQQIRTSNKNVLDWGKWQTGGMQSAFQLSKRRGRSYKLGSSYRWRVVRFEAAGVTCRLLIAVNISKQQYRATLAQEDDRDMRVIASFEFHGTHPGWHLHGACGEVTAIPLGSMRGVWQKRFPPPTVKHRRDAFGISDEAGAFEVAAKFFRLHKKPGLLL